MSLRFSTSDLPAPPLLPPPPAPQINSFPKLKCKDFHIVPGEHSLIVANCEHFHRLFKRKRKILICTVVEENPLNAHSKSKLEMLNVK